ncbi:hypothetical protein ACF068_30950 [Streptomyces sp. NPDC016309]|uniref:hypothetical protein n=1 Tax=Streptomyces sp. NPDC016309 TaxID=3364965 RepID=UPI0036FEDF22
MATPTPEEQAAGAFVEAAAEAVQTAVMAYRLVTAIADAVRRHQQRKAGEEELPDAEEAVTEASGEVRKLLPPDIGAALMEGADWPQLAQQLVALRRAGVDLEEMLPRVGEIVVTVRDAVAANAERVAAERTGTWTEAVRETMPAGPVREAILSSAAWPEMAATMARLDERGVDVRAILASAYQEGMGVGRAVSAAEAPTTSRDALLSYGPLTAGLDVPKNLDLDNREVALHQQLAIGRSENERFVRMVREALPGREREADLLVAEKRWPLIAARMARMEQDGKPVAEHLARLTKDTSWAEGRGELGRRLLMATCDALTKPIGGPAAESGAVVNTTAARAHSPSMGPTKASASTGAAPAEAPVGPHRQAGPAPRSGRTR